MGGATPTQLRNAVKILKKRGKRGLMYDEGSPNQVKATKDALRNSGVKTGSGKGETIQIQIYKDGGLTEAIKRVDAEKKFKDGKTVKADKVPNTGDLGALAAKKERTPPISKEARVKREDPNKRPRKFSDYMQRSGDSPLVALIASSLAKTGLVDKKDKVTHPMEVKKFSQGASVEAEMNRGNTTKNFKGSF